jgi:hypothetical protein
MKVRLEGEEGCYFVICAFCNETLERVPDHRTAYFVAGLYSKHQCSPQKSGLASKDLHDD